MDSSLSRRRKIRLKLLVSFNGAFHRYPLSRKLRYVGGETRIISVERSTCFQILKSKISHLIYPSVNFEQFCLKYHVSESFCGVNGEQKGPVLGLLESDDDLRCMIEEYETMELEGKLRTRVWIFVCNAGDAFVNRYSVSNVNVDGFRGKNNGFLKPIGMRSDGDDERKSENLFVLNKYENKSNKLGDDSLRKMVLKQQFLEKNLYGIQGFCGTRQQSGMELASENGISQSPPKQFCSDFGIPLSPQSKNLNFCADPCRMSVLDHRHTNGPSLTFESSGEILPVAEFNSGPQNSKDGNSHIRCKGSGGNRNGQYISSSNQFSTAGNPQKMSYSNSINWMANGPYPNCEFGTVYLASLENIYRENIVAQNGVCNMVKRGFVPPSCHYPLGRGAYPMESLQSTGSRPRAYGGCIRNHIFGLSEARNRRASPYPISTLSNVTELGKHPYFRLDGKTWIGKISLRPRLTSTISNQGPSSRPLSAAPGKPFPASHYYEIQARQRTIDDHHMPPYYGEGKLLKPAGCIVPQLETENLDNGQVAHVGHGAPILPISNSLLGARAVDIGQDLLTSSGIEKTDYANQTHGGSFLIERVDGQTPLHYVEGPHSKYQSSSLHIPCKSIFAELSTENKLLDVEGSQETLDMHQGDVKEFKKNGASAVDLSLNNLSSDRKVQLPVCDAEGHTSETSLEPQSNGLDPMDEQHNNLGPVEKSNGISSDSSSSRVSKCEKDDNERETVQHIQKPDSSSTEKDKMKKKSFCLKGNDGIPANIIALYAHLATKEPQVITNADLECIKELGHGTYGTVYHGKWKGSDVAIKRIKPSCFSNDAKEEDRLVADFWKEARTLGQLHHPNIVALYGVVIDGPVNCLATVTEYMVNGSLKQVFRRKDRTIDRRKRMMIAMDAAFGMEYLHEKNIVHFDLKSHNFLVNMRDPQRPVCKIGDLGLSKIKQRTLVSGGIRGTIPWMAPELLSGRSLVSEKVDVFSFGIVMWELLTCEEPYANMRSEEIVAGIIRGNLRPEIPGWCDPSWRSLMERCWSSNPDCRPSFSEIAKELRAMATSMNIK